MALSVAVTNPVYRYNNPANVKPKFTASGNVGSVNWSASAGTLSVVGLVATLSPPNQTQTVIVTAQDSATSVVKTAQIYGEFPLHPVFPFDADIDQKTEISESEDKTPESEVYRERGGEIITFNWSMEDATISQYKSLRDYFRLHRKVLWWYYNDLANEELLFARFDSAIRRRNAGQNRLALSCVIVGKIVG